jgi:hypothetical protein
MHAALKVTVVKKDENAFPIAISPFKLIGNKSQDKDISKINCQVGEKWRFDDYSYFMQRSLLKFILFLQSSAFEWLLRFSHPIYLYHRNKKS